MTALVHHVMGWGLLPWEYLFFAKEGPGYWKASPLPDWLLEEFSKWNDSWSSGL